MKILRSIWKPFKKLRRLWASFLSYRLASGTDRIFCHIDQPSQGQYIFRSPLEVSGWAIDVTRPDAPRMRIRVAGHARYPQPQNREDVQRAFAAARTVPAKCGFQQSIDLPLGLHRVEIEMETRDQTWRTIYRSSVLCLPSAPRQDPTSPSYQQWMKITRRRTELARPELLTHCRTMLVKPLFSVIVDSRNSTGFKATERSVRKQIYPNWEIHALVDDGSASAQRREWLGSSVIDSMAAPQVTGDFLVLVQAGDTLACNALYEFASALNADPELDMIYGDEEYSVLSKPHEVPFFKPDWSPDLLEAFNYVGHPACYRTTVARRCMAKGGYYDFVLRFTERSQRIHHVRQILLERPLVGNVNRRPPAETLREDIDALNGRLQRTGRQGVVRSGDGSSRYYETTLDLKLRPLVSIVIPTAGKTVTFEGRSIDLIVNCVSQIVERSSYRNFEIVVVDNDDLSLEKQEILKKFGCRLVTYHEPEVNIPKKLNLGASLARGEILALLNDDIELIGVDWIERMLEHFEKSHVGVVGAKLLYPSGLLQHAGVVHNRGNPAHVRGLYPRDDRGYFFSTCAVRNFMAVTGACMMTPREVYRRVGGYSEELPISFNDVDYCLKVRELGLYTVYAPKAELIHLESQSRDPTLDIRELQWYHARWARETVSDPFYNEQHLTLAPPTYEPCSNPRLI